MTSLSLLLKKSVQEAANRFGYQVTKIRPPLEILPINIFPLVIQDLMSKKAKRGEPAFFFIEIGAHDGLHGDPVRPWVSQYHWHGILVEPQPKIFKRLVENYRGEPQLIFENAAIFREDGRAVLYAFKDSPDLPDHATMLATFNRYALEHNAHGYCGEIEEIPVAALSVKTLLARHDVAHVDLLQVDTEGYDFEIIKMFAEAECKPSVVQFESAGLNSHEQRQCYQLLGDLGYRLLTIGIDTIAYDQSDDPEFASVFKNEGYSLTT